MAKAAVITLEQAITVACYISVEYFQAVQSTFYGVVRGLLEPNSPEGTAAAEAVKQVLRINSCTTADAQNLRAQVYCAAMRGDLRPVDAAGRDLLAEARATTDAILKAFEPS